jgi:hypothetical protein
LEGKNYRFAEPGEESKSVDDYIAENPVSIKLESYGSKRKNRIPVKP